MSKPNWGYDTTGSWYAGTHLLEAFYMEEFGRGVPWFFWQCWTSPAPWQAAAWNGITKAEGYAPDGATARRYCETWWKRFEKRYEELKLKEPK